MEVLKEQGAAGFVHIKGELARLEAEDKSLSAELDRVIGLQQPLAAKSDAAAAFLSTWTGVGNLLGEVSDEEKQEILRHYVEVIEFRKTDDGGKVGVYAIQLFPEVRQYFDPGDTDGDVLPSCPPRSPRTPSGATSPEEGGPAALTPEDAVVCTGVCLAPQVTHSANHIVVEQGAWQVAKSRQTRSYHLRPWDAPSASPAPVRQQSPRVTVDPLATARRYQGLLDSGTVANRAKLTRHLNVSRARVTQVLKRLSGQHVVGQNTDQQALQPETGAEDT